MSPTLYGIGTSGVERRSTGASRYSKASCVMVAQISAAKLQVQLSSERTITRFVFLIDASTASLSQGIIVRRSRISMEKSDVRSPTSDVGVELTSDFRLRTSDNFPAAATARSTIAPQVTIVRSLPS